MVTILNTGGTFNKKYNRISGNLEVPNNNEVVFKILNNSFLQNLAFNVEGCIYKDSLEFKNIDREELLERILNIKTRDIIIIHGTDTVDKSIKYIKKKAKKELKDKRIVFTGAMKPFNIDNIEATSNLTLAISFLLYSKSKNGIYIAMNGLVDRENRINKDRINGKFVLR